MPDVAGWRLKPAVSLKQLVLTSCVGESEALAERSLEGVMKDLAWIASSHSLLAMTYVKPRLQLGGYLPSIFIDNHV